MHEWHKPCSTRLVPPLIRQVGAQTWGEGCGLFPPAHEDQMGQLQPRAGHIRLNTEFVKKPKDLIEYVVVHEMMHLLGADAQ